jgi:hypothetical protein
MIQHPGPGSIAQLERGLARTLEVYERLPRPIAARPEEVERELEVFAALSSRLGRSSQMTLARSTARALGFLTRREEIRRAARARKARRGWP